MAVHTPAGIIVQTGDFKVDYTPIEGGVIDLGRFGELGKEGVLALLPDSTNVEMPGSTPSERTVGESFNKLFQMAGDRRIIIATFASNIHRIQQIIDYAAKYDKKVSVSGRSMVNVVATAIELGYLKVPSGVLVDIDVANRLPFNEVVLITTGSQGEPMSALSRMAMSEHRKVKVTPNDFIIISARPIPGNEKFVNRVVNELLQLGAEAVSYTHLDVYKRQGLVTLNAGRFFQDSSSVLEMFYPCVMTSRNFVKTMFLCKLADDAEFGGRIAENTRVWCSTCLIFSTEGENNILFKLFVAFDHMEFDIKLVSNDLCCLYSCFVYWGKFQNDSLYLIALLAQQMNCN